jgi:hypothetical protein
MLKPRTVWPLLVLLLAAIFALGSCVQVTINPTVSPAPPTTSTATPNDLAAANRELENVKTGSLAYYADQNPPAWPRDSTTLTRYLGGPLRATYSFDPNTGFITTATRSSWKGVYFQPGSSSGHGKWVKN